jgi:hypothetical protein
MTRDLYWLSRRGKSLSLPGIVFTESLDDCGGYYHPPEKSERMIDGRFFDLSKGLIVCKEYFDIEGVASTIAHEWRHHWQAHAFGINERPMRFDFEIGYDLAIKKYFQDRYELDALLFSHRFAPSETTYYWMEKIHAS